jgi:chromosomal replication initiator protein
MDVVCPNCGCDLRSSRKPFDAEAELAKKRSVSREREGRLERLRSIAATVATFYETTFDQLYEHDRSHELVTPRQMAMYLAYAADESVRINDVARLLDRDHSTVIHGIRQIERRAINENWLRDDIDTLSARLGIAA